MHFKLYKDKMVALLIFYLSIVCINGDSDLQKFELHVKSLGDKLKVYAKNSLGTSYLQVNYISSLYLLSL